MSREEEASPYVSPTPEEDKAWAEVWGVVRTPPADLSAAIKGLRAMEPCDERFTLADTIWWDIVDRAKPREVAAVQACRPPSKWKPPRYSRRRHLAIRNIMKDWGWKFSKRQPTRERDDY